MVEDLRWEGNKGGTPFSVGRAAFRRPRVETGMRATTATAAVKKNEDEKIVYRYLRHAEEQGHVAGDSLLLKDLARLDALPRAGDLDEDAGLVNACQGFQQQASQ